MSIITFDGKTVAADTRATRGSTIIPGQAIKIKEVGGIIFGITGNIEWFDAWIDVYWDWQKDNFLHTSDIRSPLKTPFTQGKEAEESSGLFLVFDNRGDGLFFRSFYWEMPYPYPITAPAAWGSGSHYALGAMRKGNAIDGVEAAIAYDCYCGGDIIAFDVATAKPIKARDWAPARLYDDGTIIAEANARRYDTYHRTTESV